jgi:hypothetical protein
MRFILTSLLFALVSMAQPLMAEDQPVVIELFTSQGCSSCPPADELLTQLAGRKDVIALALHVDYWDYLGWKDDFASANFSTRQRAYAKAGNRRTVYTPQVIVQGVSPAVGNRAAELLNLIDHHSNHSQAVLLDVERVGNTLSISITANGGSVGQSVVQLVRYVPERIVKIRGGENAGRDIIYTNIVTEWRPLTQWNGQGEISAKTYVTGSEPIVILVQTLGPGPIIAAHVLQ